MPLLLMLTDVSCLPAGRVDRQLAGGPYRSKFASGLAADSNRRHGPASTSPDKARRRYPAGQTASRWGLPADPPARSSRRHPRWPPDRQVLAAIVLTRSNWLNYSSCPRRRPPRSWPPAGAITPERTKQSPDRTPLVHGPAGQSTEVLVLTHWLSPGTNAVRRPINIHVHIMRPHHRLR
jgi:hypothetical protein